MNWQKGDVIKIEGNNQIDYVIILGSVVTSINNNKPTTKWYEVYSIKSGEKCHTFMDVNDREFSFTLHSRNGDVTI